MMKKTFLFLLMATMVAISGCKKTIEDEVKDDGNGTNTETTTETMTLRLSESSLTLVPGMTAELKATVNGAKDYTISWSSSDDEVATVSKSGVVTAKGVGEATITCVADNGSDKVRKRCGVTVEKDRVVVPDTIQMRTNKQYKLLPTTLSGKKSSYTFKTSNDDIASVAKDGTISAWENGDCVITVTSTDPEIEPAKVVVFVGDVKLRVLLNGSEISDTEVKFFVGDKAWLKTSLTGVTWTIDDPTVISINAQDTLEALAVGKANVTATYDELTVSFSVVVEEKAPEIESCTSSLPAKMVVFANKSTDHTYVISDSELNVQPANAKSVVEVVVSGASLTPKESGWNLTIAPYEGKEVRVETLSIYAGDKTIECELLIVGPEFFTEIENKYGARIAVSPGTCGVIDYKGSWGNQSYSEHAPIYIPSPSNKTLGESLKTYLTDIESFGNGFMNTNGNAPLQKGEFKNWSTEPNKPVTFGDNNSSVTYKFESRVTDFREKTMTANYEYYFQSVVKKYYVTVIAESYMSFWDSNFNEDQFTSLNGTYTITIPKAKLDGKDQECYVRVRTEYDSYKEDGFSDYKQGTLTMRGYDGQTDDFLKFFSSPQRFQFANVGPSIKLEVK